MVLRPYQGEAVLFHSRCGASRPGSSDHGMAGPVMEAGPYQGWPFYFNQRGSADRILARFGVAGPGSTVALCFPLIRGELFYLQSASPV